jgi:hypothetical protein
VSERLDPWSVILEEVVNDGLYIVLHDISTYLIACK